jgi:hypothetical protein
MRGFLRNHLDPRAATRLHSVGAVMGMDSIYSPMSGMSSMMNTFGNKRARAAAAARGLDESGTMFSGGFLANIRASGQMDSLQSKIASRSAAGKSTARYDKKLSRVGQSIRDMSSISRPGIDVFNTFETTLEDLRKTQVGTRTTRFSQATGGRVPGAFPTYGGGPGVSNVPGQQGFQRMYARPGQTYFERGGTRANNLPGNTKVNITRSQTGGFRAVLPSGEFRQISQDVGQKLTGTQTGFYGNLTASAAKGQLTGHMLGYMRGAQGFARAGGLSGAALKGAGAAVDDAIKVMGIAEARGITPRSSSGITVGKARTQQLMSSGTSMFASIDDVLAMQQSLNQGGGRGGRTLTARAFDANARNARRVAGPRAPITSVGSDLLSVNAQGFAANTSMVQGTGGKRILTQELTESIFGREAGKLAANEMLEKGILKTYGVKGTAQLLRYGGKEGAKLALSAYAGSALKVANPIMTAALVYDLTKMAATGIIGGGARFARDAIKSAQGQINKPGFGMGFVDNETAATSRARGVMAIQNSRLNARSSLGSEGSMMAARFG